MRESLSSIAAIVAITIHAVDFLKRALGGVKWARSVPTWSYAVVVSIVLTLLANLVFHTLPGDPIELCWSAVGTAATASGFQSWMNNHDTTLGDSAGLPAPDAEGIEIQS